MALEIDWNREAILTGGGGAKVAIRVRYRERGTRRWTRFLLVPQEGQPFADLVPHITRIAEDHSQGKHRRPPDAPDDCSGDPMTCLADLREDCWCAAEQRVSDTREGT